MFRTIRAHIAIPYIVLILAATVVLTIYSSNVAQDSYLADLESQLSAEARLKGEALRLKPKEYDLLLFLARNRGIVLSRDLILERVWGWDFGGGTRTVDVHVRWLREKIEAKPAEPERIVTVRGVGYRFEG